MHEWAWSRLNASRIMTRNLPQPWTTSIAESAIIVLALLLDGATRPASQVSTAASFGTERGRGARGEPPPLLLRPWRLGCLE